MAVSIEEGEEEHNSMTVAEKTRVSVSYRYYSTGNNLHVFVTEEGEGTIGSFYIHMDSTIVCDDGAPEEAEELAKQQGKTLSLPDDLWEASDYSEAMEEEWNDKINHILETYGIDRDSVEIDEDHPLPWTSYQSVMDAAELVACYAE